MTRSQSRKHRGYKTQRNVADFLRAHLFPHATAAGAGSQGSDVLHTAFDVEVKARDRVSVQALFTQMADRKKKDPSLGIVRINGQGDDASEYICLMTLGDFVDAVQNLNRCKCGSWKFDDQECVICQKLDAK